MYPYVVDQSGVGSVRVFGENVHVFGIMVVRCVASSTTSFGAIIFWYVISFYLYFLLALLYGCVIMYDKGSFVLLVVLHWPIFYIVKMQ